MWSYAVKISTLLTGDCTCRTPQFHCDGTGVWAVEWEWILQVIKWFRNCYSYLSWYRSLSENHVILIQQLRSLVSHSPAWFSPHPKNYDGCLRQFSHLWLWCVSRPDIWCIKMLQPGAMRKNWNHTRVLPVEVQLTFCFHINNDVVGMDVI